MHNRHIVPQAAEAVTQEGAVTLILGRQREAEMGMSLSKSLSKSRS